ncbi:peroxisome assembly factor 2-like [Tropilaelaps mercedesae]|uniref:Peroxisomal ATPase PEX6 n=1 Tax=Tropilaelaps mercedesae TaxID=418985 RepID=A0A1V9XPA1_9ACAR|nr:peroxisome assembly factor 2-like [Tropilaelaps mercedesae]
MCSSIFSCYRCRFTVDLHVNPLCSFVATLQNNSDKPHDQNNTSRSSHSTNSIHGQGVERTETYGAAWPPGRPHEAIVFEVAKYGDFPWSPIDCDTLEFFVSRQFVVDFELDPAKEYAFKELESCPTLQLVVLHGRRNLLQEAQTREWQNRWCETLVRPGSDLGGLTVTETRPTRFGIITLNTQMIVLEGGVKIKPVNSAGRLLRLVDRPSSSSDNKHSTSEVRKDSDRNQTIKSGSTGIDDYEQLMLRCLLVLPSKFYKVLRTAARDAASTIDPDRCVYLSLKTLSRLKISPFSWAQIEVGNVKRVVRVVASTAIQYETEDGVVLATPQLVLSVSDDQRATPCTILPIEEYPTNYAIELSVAVIKSPNYNHQSDFSAILKWHFERRPRLLAKGDVFAVSQKEFFAYAPDLRGTCAYTDEATVYFRVGSLAGGDRGEPQSLWCDYQRCTLYQSGATVSKVPRCMELMLNRSYHPVFNTPQSIVPDVAELLDLIGLFYSHKQISHTLQLLFLVSGPSSSGKNSAVNSIALALGLHLYTVRGSALTGDTPAVAETRIRNSFEKALVYGPCLLHVMNIEDMFRNVVDVADTRLVSVFLETVATLNRVAKPHPIVIVATSNEANKIPSQVMSAVLHHLVVPPIKQDDRQYILELLFADDMLSSSLDLKAVAQKTSGFVLGDLCALVDFARKNLYRRETQGPTMVGMCASLAAPILTMEDILKAISQIQDNHSKSIGAPQIPSVRWDDIGGLEAAKKEILDTIQFPLKNPNFGGTGGSLTRSGILLYGPPGTGKTLLAKAVATECSLNFLSVKAMSYVQFTLMLRTYATLQGPELINMYIGQSEQNVRKVFEKARLAAPCVIFFDELDSLAPRRGRSGDSGGVMDRVVSQLLAEMDGLGKVGSADGGLVFVIGATNRPDLLDTAILRPGRLDRLVYVDIPEEAEVKLKVLRALTRKLTLRDVDLQKLSEACPSHLTGADLYSLCASAMIHAVRRCIDTHSKKLVVVSTDFEKALEKLTPSVSVAELQKYRGLRDKFAH